MNELSKEQRLDPQPELPPQKTVQPLHKRWYRIIGGLLLSVIIIVGVLYVLNPFALLFYILPYIGSTTKTALSADTRVVEVQPQVINTTDEPDTGSNHGRVSDSVAGAPANYAQVRAKAESGRDYTFIDGRIFTASFEGDLEKLRQSLGSAAARFQQLPHLWLYNEDASQYAFTTLGTVKSRPIITSLSALLTEQEYTKSPKSRFYVSIDACSVNGKMLNREACAYSFDDPELATYFRVNSSGCILGNIVGSNAELMSDTEDACDPRLVLGVSVTLSPAHGRWHAGNGGDTAMRTFTSPSGKETYIGYQRAEEESSPVYLMVVVNGVLEIAEPVRPNSGGAYYRAHGIHFTPAHAAHWHEIDSDGIYGYKNGSVWVAENGIVGSISLPRTKYLNYTPVYSSDYRHVAWVEGDASTVYFRFLNDAAHYRYHEVKLDGTIVARHLAVDVDSTHIVDELTFSLDGAHLAYRVQEKTGFFVVIDGKQTPSYSTVSKLRFTRDARNLLFNASNSSEVQHTYGTAL